MEHSFYYKYSDYLKNKYGSKVYKLPINLPISCPNRENGTGCTFCADIATGFESQDNRLTVREQLEKNRDYIGRRYHAHQFIAYFQNYTNTYMPFDQFKNYI
ncbi:MAG: TIGR01212 family radical SAM protein, partial [Lachnospiraceae bacterium]|nr:TIGR01212 family radical SAM protein [Lachnospiraceae bacterium]